MLFGGLETGGTKMVCAIGDENGKIIERKRFDTRTPEVCLPELVEFFKQHDIKALGISCFGPIDLNKNHKTYGTILKTTKVHWAMTNIYKYFKDALNVPVGIDTDVNGACLAEAVYGAAKGYDNVSYFTIGTGIGVGVYLNGKLQHGLMHPEGGHIYVKRHPNDDFEGVCAFHKDCLEGLASGPAIEKRYGKKAEDLNIQDYIELEAYYIAQGICTAIYSYSPEKVVLGGGVMHTKGLIEEIRKQVVEQLNGYIQAEDITDNIDNYILSAGLKDDAGALGSIELAKLAYQE